ncbi:MlaD family protein [Paracrocinitomix mangrovi]|uniref:MlaD family protein n=1 Tax=Paracrocinitomix mangrovi TaxID=2862509 RepID=UPI001C8D4304|nr:MlaD family protein [Paracrocinitomix mangrovi]UKN02455.1 MlaD family protein [Paracrocinitomix mangrovi]
MKVSKEFKVGLLVVLGLLLLFVGTNFLKGSSIFGKDREFVAEFANSAGLQPSNEVQLNGVRVGQVTEVDLKEDNASRVVVRFTIEKEELLLPTDSEIWLISSDILGTKALELRIPSDTIARSNIAYYNDGDEIDPNHVYAQQDIQDRVEQEILPLKKKTEELIGSVEQIIVSVNAFWDTSAAVTIDQSLYEVRDAVAKFGDLANNLSVVISNSTNDIDVILKNLKDISSNLVEQNDTINTILSNLASVTQDFSDADLDTIFISTKENLEQLNITLTELNKGTGTLGKLLYTDSLHQELIETNIALQSLLNDFDQNPNKFVHFSLFGRKTKGYQTTSDREQLLDDVLDSVEVGKKIQYQ